MATTTDTAARMTQSDLRAIVTHLGAMDRPSATPQEREAQEGVADRLREEGCEVALETEPAHGTYWVPLGVLAAIAGLAALRAPRPVALAGGPVGAAGIADDISGGRQWFRRRFLPMRETTNVVAQAGDPEASRTV